ncbi:MAG: 4-alpha-glucanotransferase [Verrucomicrobiota bacterium]
MTNFSEPASPLPRDAGLLVPVSAMRHAHDLGIGDVLAVRQAIGFCARHGFRVLQFLPICETFGDHSPYNPISSHAFSPTLLHLHPDEVPGLTPEILERFAPADWIAQLRHGTVKHASIHTLKSHILQAAWDEFRRMPSDARHAEMHGFQETHQDWLEPFTLYRLLIREHEGNADWQTWRPELQTYPSAQRWLSAHPDRATLELRRDGYAFIQWVAARQWHGVREHAEEHGVRLMGDLPFAMSRNSADVWANPELFDPDWNMGSPPLAFFDTTAEAEKWGQNWGLPPYRWQNHRSSGFAWQKARISWLANFVHIMRIDHLRGYFRAYMFPWPGGPKHGEFSKLTEAEILLKTNGRLPRFVPGPDHDAEMANMNRLQGVEIIRAMREAAGDTILIAEIMGELPPYIADVIEQMELPHLVFPQFEAGRKKVSAFRRLSLAAYANHDNAPLASVLLTLREQAAHDPAKARELQTLLAFAGWAGPMPGEAVTDDLLASFQKALFETPCMLAILMSSDLLGNHQRFNLPGSYGLEAWCERLEFTFEELERHPIYGPRIARAAQLARSIRPSLQKRIASS